MSFNWARENMGVQNPMLAKIFGGFTSEVVAEMCTNWFEHNLYFEDFGRFHKTSQKLICEMRKKNDLGKGLKGVEALVQLCTEFAFSPITDIIDNGGQMRRREIGTTNVNIILRGNQLVRYRNYRHIHDVMVLYKIAEDNPGCHWEVDYENPSPIWQGHTAVSFGKWVDTVNPDYYLIRQARDEARDEEWNRMYEEQAAENHQYHQRWQDEYYRLRNAGYSGEEAEAGAIELLSSFNW